MSLHRLKRLATLIVRMPERIFRQLYEQAIARRSRSTALNPLGWLVSILIVGAIGAKRAGLDSWIITTLVVFVALEVVLYLGAYVFFMFKSRDALRSEQFVIEKMAIEKLLVGDSSRGIMSGDDLPAAAIQPRPQLEDTEETNP